jgi:hypothetical protein
MTLIGALGRTILPSLFGLLMGCLAASVFVYLAQNVAYGKVGEGLPFFLGRYKGQTIMALR